MMVYVATKAENYPVARAFMFALRGSGHQISHDWTTQVEALGAGPKGPNVRRRCAEEDLQGVRECDLFVLIMYKGMVGALIEYGAALALGKPVFIVVDVEAWPVDSIFFDVEGLTYMHPSLNSLRIVVEWANRYSERMDVRTDQRPRGEFRPDPVG